jgi:long-chain fatty acid transport protein
VQPNVAWQLNDRVSIGGGPVIGHSSVELVQGVDLSTTTVTGQTFTFAAFGIPKYTEFARARLKGDAWGFGAHLGTQIKLTPTWTAGLRVLTPVKFNYDDADATFTPVTTGLVFGGTVPPSIPAGTSVDALVAPAFATGGPLVSQKVKTSITHPAQVQLGFAFTGFTNWELEGDYAWIGYKSFKELKVDFANGSTPDRVLIEDYNNSSGIRLTAERRFTNDIRIRAGFAGVAAAAPDVTVTPLLPEQDRTNYGIGATVPFGSFALDVAYLRVQAAGRRGRIDERTTRTQTADQLNSGVYSLNANIFSLSLKASF